MSVEQWGVLALVVLLTLVKGVARLRRTHASQGGATGHVGEVPMSERASLLSSRNADDTVARTTSQVAGPPSSLPPPLPQPASPPAIPRSGLPAAHASSFRGSAAKTRTPVAGDAVVQWLRPVRNLRRAIVLATILGPPTQ